jgi:hypothetical protein
MPRFSEFRLAQSALRAPLIMMVVVTSVVVVPFGPRSAAAASHDSKTKVSLPVVRCATKRGANFGPRVALPARLDEMVAGDLKSKASLYVDQYDVVRMIGPTGWRCSASIAADGGESVIIYPPDMKPPQFFSSFGGRSRSSEISVQQVPACVSCGLTLVCAFFSTARELIEENYPGIVAPSTCRRHRGERVTHAAGSLRFFSDEKGVAGHAYPSGGPYLALGVASFKLPLRSYLVSCTLPRGDREFCRGALQWYAQHHQPF